MFDRLNFTPQLVIFDCDGTLVDTEKLHTFIFVEQLIEKGFLTDFESLNHRLAGKSLAKAYDIIRTELRVPYDALDEAIYMERFRQALINEGDAIAVPGALEAFTQTAERFPVTVATNGEVDLTEIKLQQCGFFLAKPDLQVFTKDVVARPKPAPDLYFHVAKHFGVDPKQCLVVEDTPTGVLAAASAGMHVVGFTGCATNDKHHVREALAASGAMFSFDSYKDFSLAN